MNESWFVYFGHQLNMSRAETMNTRYGEFMDLLDCMAIENGGAEPKEQKMTMEQVLAMR